MRTGLLLVVFAVALVGRAAPRAAGGDLAIVINRDNPIEDVSLRDLRALFMGERSSWPNGRRVTVVMREPGEATRNAVLRQVYRMTDAQFTRFVLHAVYTGTMPSAPKQLNTPGNVVRFVFNVPGAIGFVPASDTDASVKTLRIGGLAPGDPAYPLRVEAP